MMLLSERKIPVIEFGVLILVFGFLVSAIDKDAKPATLVTISNVPTVSSIW